MLRIRITPALMATAVLIFGSAASLGMITVGSSKSFAQELTNCRTARIARADLPEFCRRTCPGHPECRTLISGSPPSDCRTARIARADLPIFCRRTCPAIPSAARFWAAAGRMTVDRRGSHALTSQSFAGERARAIPNAATLSGHGRGEAGRGQGLIGVKLASYGIADIRLPFASGMGEASMHVGGGLQEVMESDAADDGDQQHTSGDVPHAPERRGISSVEQVLRGRRPGNPGRGRRTTRPG